MTISARLKDQIGSLYVGYFGRAADSAGTSYWTSQIESGAMTLDKVAASFAVQSEALARYSYLSAPTVTSPTDFIDQVYRQLFNHGADQAGLQYWSQQLATAQGNPQAVGQFILNVISGATGADDATLKSELDVAPGVTPKAPDVGTTSTVPVTPHAPTDIVNTNDTGPGVGAGDEIVISTMAATEFSTGTGSYFFVMYEIPNSRTINLTGSMDMVAADYASLIYNHFTIVAG